jgi:hypothetical protein
MPKIDPPALHFQEWGALSLGVMQRDVSLVAAMPSLLDLPQDSPAVQYMGWRLALVSARWASPPGSDEPGWSPLRSTNELN